mmetsp:Transcript_31041/g.54496  ORF Transcript_31041/g.54496 Transcript_31041/m.54496 type:complete len:243 (+) Transcript_31041:195-923(+)
MRHTSMPVEDIPILLKGLPRPSQKVRIHRPQIPPPVPRSYPEIPVHLHYWQASLQRHQLHLRCLFDEKSSISRLLNGRASDDHSMVGEDRSVEVRVKRLSDQLAFPVAERDARPSVQLGDVFVEDHDVHVLDLERLADHHQSVDVLRVSVDHALEVGAVAVYVEVESAGQIRMPTPFNSVEVFINKNEIVNHQLFQQPPILGRPHTNLSILIIITACDLKSKSAAVPHVGEESRRDDHLFFL